MVRAWISGLLLMLGHIAKNVAILGTILLAGASGATVLSAHLTLVDQRELAQLMLVNQSELANEALVRLESEIERAQLSNLTQQQAAGPLGNFGRLPNQEGILEASRWLREAADVWRNHASDGNYTEMNAYLQRGYEALKVAAPEPIDFQAVPPVKAVATATGLFGRNWPVPPQSMELGKWALYMAIGVCILDAAIGGFLASSGQVAAMQTANPGFWARWRRYRHGP